MFAVLAFSILRCWSSMFEVTLATTLGRMLYSSPACWGFLNKSDLNGLESFLCCARRDRLLPDEASTFKNMVVRGESTHSGAIITCSNHHHVLRYLYMVRCLWRVRATIINNLRPRSVMKGSSAERNSSRISCAQPWQITGFLRLQ